MNKKQNLRNSVNSKIKIGCDIVDIRRFSKIDRSALLKLFYESEIRNANPQKLAGLFAAKESCRKVFNRLNWHDIIISNEKSGRPLMSINKKNLGKNIILSSDLGISHDGNYAIAVSIFLLSEK